MTTKRLIAVILVISVAVAIVALSCTDETGDPPDSTDPPGTTDPPGDTDPPGATDPPIITALEVTSDRVLPSASTEIVCVASSPDGDELSYEWSCDDGEIEGTGDMVTWTAPSVEGDYTVSVIVSDTRGATATESLVIAVTANEPPRIDSLTADAEWVYPEGTLLVYCQAWDPDGDELTYDWSRSDGQIIGTGPEVTWIAPAKYGEYRIIVAVDDGYGGSVTETIYIKVMPDQPPDIEPFRITHKECKLEKHDDWTYTVGNLEEYSIECLVSDTVPGTDMERFYELSYKWDWDDGEVSEDGSVITWVAPDADTDVTITVTVSDIAGNTATQSVTLRVTCSPCKRWPSC